MGGAAIVDHQHQRRHRALGHRLIRRLCRCLVDQRRLRAEQAKLETVLLRILHRQPAIVAVAGVGMEFDAELPDIKFQRLVLVANVKTGYFDTLAHMTSYLSEPPISSASRRRFSETAMLRFGRRAALTKQWGTSSSSWATDWSCSRNSAGALPVMSRKMRPNVPRLDQPVSKAMSVMGRSVSRRSAVAFSIRRVRR